MNAPSPPDLATLEQHFRGDSCGSHSLNLDRACAAVAMIFRPTQETRLARGSAELELCFVRRAKFPGDPWSGDMAFPGGKSESNDYSFHDVAVRETFEETGLRVGQEHLLGALPEFEVQPGSRFRRLLLRPMVYFAEEDLGVFNLSHEVDDAYWIPLRNLWDPARCTTVDWGRLNEDYPGIRYDSHVIWGLTYRMLEDCARALGCPLPAG